MGSDVTATGRSPRVVDFSTHFSGPLAAQLLVQLGADVVKVENPKVGDGNRGVEPLIAGEAMLHIALNAGKRSLAVSSRSPEWKPVVEACARWADVVIVSGQPAALKKRGLDFDGLVCANPELVHCTVTGYGESGPWSEYPSHGLNTDVLAGLVPVEWIDGTPRPRAEYRSAGTTLAGVHAALGVFAALHRRDRGEGAQRVSVSIWESAVWWSWRDAATFANLGQPWLAYQDLGSRYAMYRTSDERAVLVCPIEQRFWVSFCDVLGLPEELKERGSWSASGMDFGEGYDDERVTIAAIVAQRPLEEWTRVLADAEIPFAPLLTIPEVLASEQADAIGLLAETEVAGELVKLVASPVKIAAAGEPLRTAPLVIASPPRLGEHNDSVLAEIGVEAASPEEAAR